MVTIRCNGDWLCAVLAVLHPQPELPKRLAEQHQPLYQFLLNKWYFDELYDLIFVRPAMWLGRFLWKKGDGWLIDGFGPDGVSARVMDVAGRIVKLQSGYRLSLRLRHADRGRVPDHLVHVRRSSRMTGWYHSINDHLPAAGRCSVHSGDPW